MICKIKESKNETKEGKNYRTIDEREERIPVNKPFLNSKTLSDIP